MHRSPRLHRTIASLAFAGGALGLSACGGGAAVSPVATTTTTTLPASDAVLATTPSGAASFEGSVMRVPVAPLANGSSSLPIRPGDARVLTGTVKIAYRQFGSGPNLLLAMGQHGSMTWWDPLFLQQLAHSYRVTIFDDPSLGYSLAMARPPSVETDGDIMAGLVAALGLSNVTVLGWGMGGEAALSLVERHPASAIGLVLVDASAGGPAAIRPPAAVSAVFASPEATVAQLAGEMFPGDAAGAAARAAWLTDIATVEPDDVLFDTVTKQAAAQNAFFTNSRTARLLPVISLPTLVFAGARDAVVPPRNSTEIAGKIAGAKLVLDPGVGYASLFEDATTFIADLTTFMSRVATSTTTTTVP